jgi:hypothetical protein
MTMNSPESLLKLYSLATGDSKDQAQSVRTAEQMREVGLKCIGFNGVCLTCSRVDLEPLLTEVKVPRTINCLGAFRSGLPSDIISALSTKPTRYVTSICSCLESRHIC